MATLSQSLRRRAREAERGWGDVEWLGLFGSGFAGSVGLFVLTGPLAVVPVGAAMGFGLAAFVGHRLCGTAKLKAEDPPRDDFLEPVTPDIERVDLERLTVDRFSGAAVNLAREALEAASFERAMVLADERSEGARLAGLTDPFRARRGEALRWGLAAARAGRVVAWRAREFADVLDESSGVALSREDLQRVAEVASNFPSSLPAGVQRAMARAGVDLGGIPTGGVRPPASFLGAFDPFGDMAGALRAAAETTVSFSNEFEDERAAGPTAQA